MGSMPAGGRFTKLEYLILLSCITPVFSGEHDTMPRIGALPNSTTVHLCGRTVRIVRAPTETQFRQWVGAPNARTVAHVADAREKSEVATSALTRLKINGMTTADGADANSQPHSAPEKRCAAEGAAVSAVNHLWGPRKISDFRDFCLSWASGCSARTGVGPPDRDRF